MKMVVPASWEDLPADLIGLVLLRVPSLADRVRLRVACRPWRAAAKQMKTLLPPPLPWLAFRDGSIVDLDGARVRCAPILRDGVFRYLAVDSLAFLIHHDGSCSLMNPLSGLTLPLPKIYSPCRVPSDRQSNQLPRTRHARDIAFLNGKHEASTPSPSMKGFGPSSLMPISSHQKHWRWMAFPRKARLGTQDRTSRFEVLEADLSTVPGQWVKVDSLDGQAIFLSNQCSKSVIAGQSAGGVQADCIYFMHRVVDNPYGDRYGNDPLGDSGVYNMRDKEIKPLLGDAVMEELKRKKQFLTWFFPVDA
ncbi:unnamed protein product [Urochloa decumbens]|uniref:KIB1-4 beta-propeller domain-containing protein n=1 Tax=Urochloa decumbens TaxID=240449 RepID=A0ABC9BSY7_9POAL